MSFIVFYLLYFSFFAAIQPAHCFRADYTTYYYIQLSILLKEVFIFLWTLYFFYERDMF